MFEILLSSMKVAVVAPGGYALFHHGNKNGSASILLERYQYSNGVVNIANTAPTTQRRTQHAGASNHTESVFATGFEAGSSMATTVRKFAHAGNTIVAAGDILTGRVSSMSLGNNTKAFFIGGVIGAVDQTVNDAYTYASATSVAGAALGTARYLGYGTGHDSAGYIFGGRNSAGALTSNDKYSYIADTMVAATALQAANYRLQATSTAAFAWVAGGVQGAATAVSRTFAFSNESWAAATSLSVAHNEGAAAGNTETAVVGGGRTAINNTSVRTYANDTVAAGTVLTEGKHSLAATSTSPGGY